MIIFMSFESDSEAANGEDTRMALAVRKLPQMVVVKSSQSDLHQ